MSSYEIMTTWTQVHPFSETTPEQTGKSSVLQIVTERIHPTDES
jgi:hypothetical protein